MMRGDCIEKKKKKKKTTTLGEEAASARHVLAPEIANLEVLIEELKSELRDMKDDLTEKVKEYKRLAPDQTTLAG